MTFIPTYSDPSDALVSAFEGLLRNGPGGGISSPSWPVGTPAPEGHWLLPMGTQLYRYDEPDQAKPPAVLIAQHEQTTRRTEHDARFWTVPIYLGIIWARDMSRLQPETIRRRLECLFGVGVMDDGVARPITQLLTTDRVQVHHVRSVAVDFLKDEQNRPKFEVYLTYFDSGRHTES